MQSVPGIQLINSSQRQKEKQQKEKDNLPLLPENNKIKKNKIRHYFINYYYNLSIILLQNNIIVIKNRC